MLIGSHGRGTDAVQAVAIVGRVQRYRTVSAALEALWPPPRTKLTNIIASLAD